MKKVNHRWMRICSMLLVLTLLGNDCIGSTGIVFGAQLDQGIEDSLIDGESVDDNNVGDNGGESGEGERTEDPDMESSDDTGLTDNPDDTDIPEAPLDNNTEDTVQDAETEDTVDEEISEFLLDDEEQTVLIAEEDISQRSSNIKHFKKRDNTFVAAVYPDPVHYQENGEWREIDNRLVDAGEEDNTPFWGNQANQLNVKFAKKSNGKKLVKLKLDDFQISWGLKDAQKVDAVQKDTVSERLEPGTEHHDIPSKKESEEMESTEPQDSEGEESDLMEPASLLTENPEAAQSGLSLENAEKEYGAKIQNLPENNTTEGILPEEREGWNTTHDPGEETMDASYFSSAEEYNREMMAVENLYSDVVYGDILPGVDLEYILESQRVKENIIIKDSNAPNRFVFQYQAHGMEPVQDGNRILFRDGEGKDVFEIDAPFVYDADGEFSTDVSVELKKGNGKKCEITVTVDEAWLSEEGRTFPVVVDPAIRTDQDATSIQDTYVLSTSPNTNFYNRSVLKTGIDSSGGVTRSFMRFTLPNLKTGDMVIDAKLYLYCYSSGNAQRTVTAHKIWDSSWISTGVTWMTMPDTDNTAEDYAVFTTEVGKCITFDITTMAQEWLREGECGGVMIRASREDGDYTEYVSSDYSSSAKECRPSVIFGYINNSGLEDYWTYHEQNIGRAGTGYVNDYNGNMILVHDTVSTTGNLMPISLTHVYNTNDQGTNMGYGNGWRLNYHQTIKEQTITGVKYYIYTDEDGTQHYFYYDDEKKEWLDESGLDLKLSITTGAAYAYTVTDKSDNKLLFNSGGNLVCIEDQNGNALTITYTSGKISSIHDGAGRTVTLSYNSSGLLSTVEDPYQKTKTFTYQGSQLTQITDTDGEVISYIYNGNGMLETVQNIDGYNIHYTYSEVTPHRVEQVEENSGSTAGQMFSIDRWSNHTTFTDREGRKEIYLFNHTGNTISVRNDKGQAQSSRYLTGGSNSNKISKVSKLQTTAVNLLQNSYLESDTGWNRIQEEASVTLHADAAKALVGTNTFHMVSTKDTGKGGCQQSVNFENGKTYTFSAYVNAPDAVLEQGKCEVQIQATLASGDTIYSEEVDYYKTEDRWYRLITTLSLPETESVSSGKIYAGIRGKADVYFDCFQLEEGKAASRYNLITNGDFRNGTSGYTGTGTNLFDRVRILGEIYEGLQVTYRRGTVTGDSVNLRTGPGTGNSAVTTVTKNTEITIIGDALDSGGITWYYTYVIKSGQVYSGYIISSYVSVGTSERTADKAVVDASSLNVRKGPGKDYASLTTVSRNETLYVVDMAASSVGQQWALVYFEKSGTKYVGYILYDYIYQEWTEPRYSDLEAEYLDENVYHMTGNPAFVKKLTQTLQISGKTGDTYTGNLWGCGDPTSDKDNRTFGLEVEFVLNDGTSEIYTSNFRTGSREWQFLHDVFVAKHPYKKINVSCIYSYQTNVVMFDGLGFYREDFSESYVYDAKGNVISVQDNAKNTSKFEYDTNNNISKITDPKGSNFTYTYDSKHNVQTAVSAEKTKYTFTYDSKGNPTTSKVTNADADTGPYIQSGMTYTADGNYAASVTDPLGNTVRYEYDALDRLASVLDARMDITRYVYDSYGHLTEVNTDVDEADTAKVQYTYEKDELKTIATNGISYTLSQDSFGNPAGVAAGSRQLVSKVYEDYNGNLASLSYGNGFTWLYDYDDLDRLVQIRMKDTNDQTYVMYRYEYDQEGNLCTEYDVREDLGTETITTRYFYDLSGRLAYCRNDRDEDYRYTYDQNNQVTKIENGNQFRKTETVYTYDKDGREKTAKTAAKTRQTAYDTLGRVQSHSWTGTGGTIGQVDYIYDPGANGSQSNQLQKMTYGSDAISYTYDNNGNITSIQTEDGTVTYEYDELYRLIREDNQILDQTIAYIYTFDGDLCRKKIYDYMPDTDLWMPQEIQPEETILYEYTADGLNLLTEYDGQTITYDAIGNPLQYRGMNLTWSNGRELYSASKNGTTTTYRYNKDGMRNRKYLGDGTVLYQIQGSLISGEQKIGQDEQSLVYELEYYYDSDGNILSMLYNGTEYYYLKNIQGDIIGILDGSGTSVVEYSYDSWGKVIEISGNQELGKRNPFRYRGYYYDEETGFYYVSSRYYDPEIGRWINADDAIAGVGGDVRGYNLFSYCMNNPVNMSDHTGHWPQWIKNAASAVVSAVKKAVTVVVNTVKSAVSSASNILKASSNSLPKKGEPGSSQTLPNPDGTPKQKRWYGPDGNPERDRDYNHPGNMPFPHDHEWKNGERGKDHLSPDPSYKMNWEPVIGVGLVFICTVGIIAVAADDVTVVGVADDFLFGPLGAGVGEGLIMIFG